MKKIITVLILSLSITSCTQAKRSKFGNLVASRDGQVKCYSGGVLIYEGYSTGKVISETNSDGYAFVDRADKKLKEVSGDCIITYGGGPE